MEDIRKNVKRLRMQAGWASQLDAFVGTQRLVDEGKIPEPIKPGVWSSLESRSPGRHGPTLMNLLRVRAALSIKIGRPIPLDEIVTGSLFELAGGDATQREDPAQEGIDAAKKRSRRGRRSDNGSPRKGER